MHFQPTELQYSPYVVVCVLGSLTAIFIEISLKMQ